MTVGVAGNVSPTATIGAGADRAKPRSPQAGRCAAGSDRTAVGLGGMQRAPVTALYMVGDICTDSEICVAEMGSTALNHRISLATGGGRSARMSGVVNLPIKTGKVNGAHDV